MQRLKRRRDFVAASRSPSFAARGVVVQRRARDDDNPARVGFTVTRKLGGAVTRNRIRRRLKEAVRLCLADRLEAGMDYVFVGRAAGLARPFDRLGQDLREALDRLAPKPRAAAAAADA